MKHIAFALALLAISVSARPSVDPATAEGIRLIEAWADASQAYGRWPALSVAVGKGDNLIWSKGYGYVDAAGKVPTQGDTVYSICSISKLFTSIAVMQQWEAGRLMLDEPITTYLPWARPKADDRDSLPITLRALLTHSAGVQRDSITGNWTGPDYPFPDRELLRSDFQAQPPLYSVGRVYQYSNIGLSLAGEAAVAVSRKEYARLVETSILTPLGLKDTRPFLPLDLLGTRLAVGWSPLDRTGQRSLLKPFDTKAITPAAGFSSTAEDLVRFGLWQAGLLRQEKAGSSVNVLRPSTLREMHRVQFTDHVRKSLWGLGFVVEQDGDKSYVGHDGSCPGYHTAMLLRPDTETVVAVMTTDNHEVWGDAMQAHKLLDARNSHSFKGPPPVAVNLEDYAGRYVDGTWENETIILPWNGGLVTLDLPDAKPAESLSFLKPIATDRFRRIAKDGSEMHEVSFQRDAGGRVLAILEFFNRSMRVVL